MEAHSGDRFAEPEQIGVTGEQKRTDRMGLLLLISPPGYGKTTLMDTLVGHRLPSGGSVKLAHGVKGQSSGRRHLDSQRIIGSTNRIVRQQDQVTQRADGNIVRGIGRIPSHRAISGDGTTGI